MKSEADHYNRFPELSSDHLTSNEWNVVGNTLYANMIEVS